MKTCLKYLLALILIIISLSQNSCSDFNGNKKFQLDGKDEKYEVTVYDELNCKHGGQTDKVCPCDTYKTLEFIWNKLEGESGNCNVFYYRKCYDKFGNYSEEYLYSFTINLNLMNKYQTFRYWENDWGHTRTGSYINDFPECPN
jgi:hypothetical protein